MVAKEKGKTSISIDIVRVMLLKAYSRSRPYHFNDTVRTKSQDTASSRVQNAHVLQMFYASFIRIHTYYH